MGGYRHFYKHVLLFKWMLHVNGVSLTDSSPFLFLGLLVSFFVLMVLIQIVIYNEWGSLNTN